MDRLTTDEIITRMRDLKANEGCEESADKILTYAAWNKHNVIVWDYFKNILGEACPKGMLFQVNHMYLPSSYNWLNTLTRYALKCKEVKPSTLNAKFPWIHQLISNILEGRCDLEHINFSNEGDVCFNLREEFHESNTTMITHTASDNLVSVLSASNTGIKYQFDVKLDVLRYDESKQYEKNTHLLEHPQLEWFAKEFLETYKRCIDEDVLF